jgi:TusA-related sulfurtransferase
MLRPVAVTVDGTLLTCKGVIARLEKEFSDLPSGSLVRVLVNEIPNRLDVRAWADRKGHRVVDEERRGEKFELVLAKGGPLVSPLVSGAVRSSR